MLPPATKLGQGYIFTGVCHSVHKGGGSTWAGTPPGPGTPPRDQVHPPGTRCTPWDQVHPPGTRCTPRYQVHPPRDQVHPQEQCMPGDTDNKRAVRILLECILVANDFDARKMLDATRFSSTPFERGPVSFSLMFFMVDQKGVKVCLHFFDPCPLLPLLSNVFFLLSSEKWTENGSCTYSVHYLHHLHFHNAKL